MFLSFHDQTNGKYIIIDINLSKPIRFELTESKFMESANRSNLIRIDSNRQLARIQRDPHLESDPLLLLNAELDTLKLPHVINERSIERFLTRLEDSGYCDQSSYWLVLARIFELAMLCAGHYADNGEFSAAGDLLVNPRKVFIHQKGHQHSLVKRRHGRISDQVNKGGRNGKNLFLLLKHEVAVEIAKPAILPHLFKQMQDSRRIASWYLHHSAERMKKIADAIGFLSAWAVSGFGDLHNRLREVSPETRRFVDDHLCRFDTRCFERLGQEIQKLIKNFKETCEFVAHQ